MCKRNTAILSLFFLGLAWHAFAQEKVTGEIININHQYKIAFTDISSDYLRKGDLVEIYADGNFVSYLEVSEASGAISKLIPPTQPGKSKGADFSKIAVGNRVIKILPSDGSDIFSPPVVPSRPASVPESHGISGPEVKSLSENYAKLSDTITGVMKEKDSLQNEYHRSRQELEIALGRVKELEAQNASFAKEIEQLRKEADKRRTDKSRERIKALQETIAALKSKLKRMAELMDKNIKAYEEN
jgi:hypothetical protein